MTARLLLLAPLALSACEPALPPQDLDDDPVAYIEDAGYRRGILLRDLTTTANRYAEDRLANYGLGDAGWDLLPAVDRPSRALTDEDVDALIAGAPLEPGRRERLVPDALPATEEAWIALGRRVFFEYPLRADPTYTALAAIPGGLEDAGFLRDEAGDWVGLRVFTDDDGAVRLGNSCAQCHASYDGGDEPALDGILSNRAMDVGVARLLTLGLVPGELPPELESSSIGDLDRLGGGRSDVLPDGRFNPYAFPDFGGLRDLPYLHHNANWHHRGTATLAVRCETLFVTSSGRQTRIPRVLSWALATWQRSLPPPSPADPEPSPLAEAGAQVFADAGCDGCHTPPLYSSDREVQVEDIGTDPAAGDSIVRWSGHYRIPSLRGVGRAGPYLHDGSVGSLEEMFDPKSGAGHPYGKELSAADREALVAFLRSI